MKFLAFADLESPETRDRCPAAEYRSVPEYVQMGKSALLVVPPLHWSLPGMFRSCARPDVRRDTCILRSTASTRYPSHRRRAACVQGLWGGDSGAVATHGIALRRRSRHSFRSAARAEDNHYM